MFYLLIFLLKRSISSTIISKLLSVIPTYPVLHCKVQIYGIIMYTQYIFLNLNIRSTINTKNTQLFTVFRQMSQIVKMFKRKCLRSYCRNDLTTTDTSLRTQMDSHMCVPFKVEIIRKIYRIRVAFFCALARRICARRKREE